MGWSDDASTGNDSKDAPATQEKGEKPTADDEQEQEDMTDDSSTDLSSLAPSAMDVSEASENEAQHKIMCWSNEGQGKTHFGYTMPEPVCIIDTENKADDIAHKFKDKEVLIWQPDDFDEACQHRDEALNVLSQRMGEKGQRGTIMIDSMAVMWEWSQYKFIEEWYPNTPPEDVEIELQNWPKIKDYHNNHFRKPLESCDFHVYFTSTRKDDISTVIQDDSVNEAPDKPGGEKDNVYKVNSIIRLYLNSNGIPVGDLQKSGMTRFKYTGLERPTYQKHIDLIDEISRIESEGADNIGEVTDMYDLDYNVSFTEANTMRYLEQ